MPRLASFASTSMTTTSCFRYVVERGQPVADGHVDAGATEAEPALGDVDDGAVELHDSDLHGRHERL